MEWSFWIEEMTECQCKVPLMRSVTTVFWRRVLPEWKRTTWINSIVQHNPTIYSQQKEWTLSIWHRCRRMDGNGEDNATDRRCFDSVPIVYSRDLHMKLLGGRQIGEILCYCSRWTIITMFAGRIKTVYCSYEMIVLLRWRTGPVRIETYVCNVYDTHKFI